MKATEQYFPVVPRCVVLTFWFVGEIIKCDHASERHWAELSFALQGGSSFYESDYGMWYREVIPFN